MSMYYITIDLVQFPGYLGLSNYYSSFAQTLRETLPREDYVPMQSRLTITTRHPVIRRQDV
jgi:hypothetical protein